MPINARAGTLLSLLSEEPLRLHVLLGGNDADLLVDAALALLPSEVVEVGQALTSQYKRGWVEAGILTMQTGKLLGLRKIEDYAKTAHTWKDVVAIVHAGSQFMERNARAIELPCSSRIVASSGIEPPHHESAPFFPIFHLYYHLEALSRRMPEWDSTSQLSLEERVAAVQTELVPPDLLSTYLQECRRLRPKMNDEAKAGARELFKQLSKSHPSVSSRVFQTLISLSVARARGEMLECVERRHVDDAFEVLVQGSNFTLTSGAAPKKKSKNELSRLTKTLEEQAQKGKCEFTKNELVRICQQLDIVNPERVIASMLDVDLLLRPPYPPKTFKFNLHAF
eukprot:GEMP01026233.1.p1 GENE.GEMP01026233.1~~GEMP01026233.1.p1  ORF type:complete len:339 (+),score=79.77 GEMP01026233.1:216-1232(+)